MYSIGQVSAMTNLPISTLRYYDKEGFSRIWRSSPGSGGSVRQNWMPSV